MIGSVALVLSDPQFAHFRAMSVDPGVAKCGPIVGRLGKTAVVDACEQGYLKLLVHTSRSGVEQKGPFHWVGFELSKESWIDGKHMLEFYQNIYERPSPGAPGSPFAR